MFKIDVHTPGTIYSTFCKKLTCKISTNRAKHLIKSLSSQVNYLTHNPSYSPRKIEFFSCSKRFSMMRIECSREIIKKHFSPGFSWNVFE